MLDPKTVETWRMFSVKTKVSILSAVILIPLFLIAVPILSRNIYGAPIQKAGPDEVGYARIESPWQGEDPLTHHSGPAQLAAHPRMPEPARISPKSALSLSERALLDAHFAALGGVDNLARVQSVRIKAMLQLPGNPDQDLVVLKKSGDRVRITVRAGNWQRTATVTPDGDWYAVWKAGQLQKSGDLDPLERAAILRYPHVKNELLMALEQSWNIHYTGEEIFQGRRAHGFEIVMEEGRRVRFFLDPESHLCLGREEWEKQSDGRLSWTHALYEDYMDVGGYVVPARTTTLVEGEVRQILIVQEMEMNAGILDSVFQLPQT